MKTLKYIQMIKIIIFIIIFNIYFSFNNKPKISIIMPIYNKEEYLYRSIGSVLNQTFNDYELIAINDCSTDNSLKILRKFSKKDSRIKIIVNVKKSGCFYSRAVGITKSSGQYLMFLDPDDLLEGNNNLKYLYNHFKATKDDIITFKYIDKKQKLILSKCQIYNQLITQPKIFNLAFKNNLVNDDIIWNKLIKRKLIMKVMLLVDHYLYEGKWNHHDDNVLSLFVHKYAKSMRCLKKIIYVYERNKDSVTRNKGNLLELKNIIYRHENFAKIFDKDTEIFFLNTIYKLIYSINHNPLFLNIVKKKNDLKFRVIKIISDFINRYHSKKMNLKKIFKFLYKIES